MTRLELALPLLAALAVACADDSTAMTIGTETTAATTSSSSSDATSEGPTSAPDPTSIGTLTTGPDPTTGPEPTTATVTSDPTATTTQPGTTTEPETTTTETTGGGACGVDGPDVGAELVHVGKPDPCVPLEFTGTRMGDEKGPVWQLDGCPCGDNCLVPDPWSFTAQGPAEWFPLLPACPRIVVDRIPGFGGMCQFVAVSVWDLEAPGQPAVYHAGRGFTPTGAAAGELTITPHSLQTCDCEGCCQPAELWDLQLTLGGADITLGEGESGALGQRDAINFESHHSGLCDAPPDSHWAIRKPA
jgi:hypothetical protein